MQRKPLLSGKIIARNGSTGDSNCVLLSNQENTSSGVRRKMGISRPRPGQKSNGSWGREGESGRSLGYRFNSSRSAFCASHAGLAGEGNGEGATLCSPVRERA